MHLKLIFLLLIINSLMYSQNREKLFNEDISFKYEIKKDQHNTIGVIGSAGRQAYATFIENNGPEKNQQYFQHIKFTSTNLGKKPSEIYLCIYENNNGLPGNIIDGAKFLVRIPALTTFIIADLSQLKIKVPVDGYFLGFEWLLEQENEIKGNTSTSNLPYNPTIKGYTGNKVNLYSKHKEWRKESDTNFVAGLALEISYIPNL